jgi:hypothetical protein
MNKLFAAFFAVALCVMAADFWAKPSPEWSDKELQKMMTNSPWAKSYSLGQPGGGGGGDSAPAPISEKGGGGGGGGRGGGGGGGGAGAPPGGSVGGGSAASIVARWQSALPVKQAFVRLKYGAEAATSADAKKILEREETTYTIVLSGPFAGLLRSGNPETMKKGLMDASSLSAKGKDVMPTEVQMGANDMLFTFPRTAAFTLDDKEVDFSTKLGELTLKYKFKLKDMVFNGKLEL